MTSQSTIAHLNPCIRPAERVQLVQEYYFSRKLKQISEMRQNGIDVINLGIGSPDQPPSENVIQVLCNNAHNPSNHGYQSYNGTPALRSAFSEWYRKYFGIELNPASEILPLIGSKEGIMHISMAFLNPGDEVLVPNPGYPAYEAATKIAGGKVIYYNLKEENGWLPDINEIENNGVSRVKIMWINYPHMPTGTRATAKLFSDLVAFAGRHNILLCNDNPYSFILNDNHLSLFSINGSGDVAIELNSLSKSHNMAGWRIGMVAGNAVFINAITRIKSNMDSGMFQPLQAAAAEALKATDKWYESVNIIYRRRRLIAEDILKALSCTFNRDQSGLFLWGKIPEGYETSEQFAEPLLQEAHVFITPGVIFGSNGDRYIRISLCADEKVLSEAKHRIKKYRLKNRFRSLEQL